MSSVRKDTLSRNKSLCDWRDKIGLIIVDAVLILSEGPCAQKPLIFAKQQQRVLLHGYLTKKSGNTCSGVSPWTFVFSKGEGRSCFLVEWWEGVLVISCADIDANHVSSQAERFFFFMGHYIQHNFEVVTSQDHGPDKLTCVPVHS